MFHFISYRSSSIESEQDTTWGYRSRLGSVHIGHMLVQEGGTMERKHIKQIVAYGGKDDRN